MEIKYTQLDNVNGEITVKVEAKDYADKVKKQLKEIGMTRPEPGFRPGHTPEGLLRRKYGKSVKYDVINKEVGDKVYDYIREQKLRVLGNPVPVKESDEAFNIDDDDFTFTFKVGLAPELDTKVNKDLHVPFYTIKVSDEMIDNQSDSMRQRMGSQVPGEQVEENALVKGVLTELNEDGSVKEDGIVVDNGILAPSYFKSKEQKELFLGHKVGDKVVFNPAATCDGNEAELSSMLNIDKDQTAAHHGDFSLEIKEIIVVKPAELDQEYFDNVFGKDKVHDEKEYRESIREMLAARLLRDSNYRFTIDARNAIMNAVGEVTLPDEVLKDYLLQVNEKLTKENVGEEYAAMRPQLVWQIVRDEIADNMEIKVSEEDLLNTARNMAAEQFAAYGMTNVPAETLDKYAHDILADRKFREQLFNTTLENKLFRAIQASVTVDNKEVSVEEFNALFAAPEA